jgi:hypothetical protein
MFGPPMPRARSTRPALLSALVAAALASSGCALTSSTAAFVDIDRPELSQFAVAAMTDMERDVRLETGSRDKGEKLTPALFWTGIGVGTATSVGAIAFGVVGFVTKNQLSDGYEGDGLTEGDRDQLVSRGQAANSVSVALTTVAVISYALSIVTYGVDWNRCGPLVRKHKTRRCDIVLGTD